MADRSETSAGGSMSSFLTTRMLRALITLWAVLTIVFVASRMSGDPIQLLYPEGLAPEAEIAMRVYLGLDRSLPEQYVSYVKGLFQADLGTSMYQQRPVMTMLLERFPATISLAVLAFAVSLVTGVAAGITAALNRGKVLDRVIMSLSFASYALPNFVLGIGLILIFSFSLHLLPSSGQGTWRNFVMPVITLGLSGAAGIARFTRSAMLDVLAQDYLRTAAAKGVARSVVVGKHALRNAAIPVLTIVGLQVGSLVAGSVVVETVFAWPGIGSMLSDAALGRDFSVIQAGVLVVAASVIVANLLVDVGYGLLDPRIRVEA